MSVMKYLAHFHKFILYNVDNQWLNLFVENLFDNVESDRFINEIFTTLLKRDKGKEKNLFF